MKTEQLSHNNFQRKTFKNMGKQKKKKGFFFFFFWGGGGGGEMLKQINKSMILTGSFVFSNKYQVLKI